MNSAQPPTSSMAVVRIMPIKKMATALYAAAAWHRDQADAVHQPHHAEAVNRADRPAEEPAVDELVLFDGGVNDLDPQPMQPYRKNQ